MDIFCIASGAMISSGLFLLPAVVYKIGGPGIVVAYLIGGFLMVPAMLSQAELATAMPKTGGAYFFVYRSLGPFIGTFAGFANWLSITLKGAFALVGIGAFIQLFYPTVTILQIKLIACAFLAVFFLINSFGIRESSKAQLVMVVVLLGILVFYVLTNVAAIDVKRYTPFLPQGMAGVWTVTGMVFISYSGLTQIDALAGETKNPGKNIPYGMIASFFVVTFLYVASVFVTVGVLDPNVLMNSYTPLAKASSYTTGIVGAVLLSVGALLAFATTANAGLLAASRMLLAMSYDNLLPERFAKKKKKREIPLIGLMVSAGAMLIIILALSIESLTSFASEVSLILYFLLNLSVIFMRESKIITYKPAFKSPLYPFSQIFGMVLYTAVMIVLGFHAILFTCIFLAACVVWYLLYCKNKAVKDSALIRIIERFTSRKSVENNLHKELTDILRERDNIVEDKFDAFIRKATIIDIKESITVKKLFLLIAEVFAKNCGVSAEDIYMKLIRREEESSTVIYSSLAVPHVVLEDLTEYKMCIFRALEGVDFLRDNPTVTMIFAMAIPKAERQTHLETLLTIGQLVQDPEFQKGWIAARDESELRSLILVSERKRYSPKP